MDEINKIQNRINKKQVKEKKILKLFNVLLILFSFILGGLIYCKQDEDGTLLKKLFNVDISFKEFNNNIKNIFDNLFSLKNQNEKEQSELVSMQDLYISLGNNNYTTVDKTIKMLTKGQIVVSSYQNEYLYFVAIQYDNGVQALYTLISEIKTDEKILEENTVFGVYEGEYFNCIFKRNNQVISYNEAIK